MNKLVIILLCAASIALGVIAWVGSNKATPAGHSSEIVPKAILPANLKGRYVREYYKPNAKWEKSEDVDFGVYRIYETSGYGEKSEPTNAQVKAAKDLQIKAFDNAKNKGWFDYKEGIKAGYRIVDDIDVLHYVNSDYVSDNKILDPERPEVLMYYPTKSGMRLLGVMFLSGAKQNPGEQIGGALTLWHIHKWPKRDQCWVNGIPLPYTEVQCEVKAGVVSGFTPEMLHVWFVMHPGGPFSTDMCVPAEVIDEPNILEYLLKIENNRNKLITLQGKILTNEN